MRKRKPALGHVSLDNGQRVKRVMCADGLERVNKTACVREGHVVTKKDKSRIKKLKKKRPLL